MAAAAVVLVGVRFAPAASIVGAILDHHARCAHMAVPNQTDRPRVAHVVIFMDQTTTYVEKNHVVTDPLDLQEGERIKGELFPAV